MWTWAKQGGALSYFSDRFLGTAEDEFGLAQLAELSPAEREQQRRTWILRSRDEYRSLVAFAELLSQLTELRAPLDVIGCASRLVRDETRHVELCIAIVHALGGMREDAGEPRWVRSDKHRPVRDRVAMTMVSSLCVGETVSVAMIAAALGETEHPVLRAVTTSILADESFHSRFGFAWAESTFRTLPLSTRLYVENSLPTLLARMEEDQVPRRRSLFRHTVQATILPGLVRAGVRVRERLPGLTDSAAEASSA